MFGVIIVASNAKLRLNRYQRCRCKFVTSLQQEYRKPRIVSSETIITIPSRVSCP